MQSIMIIIMFTLLAGSEQTYETDGTKFCVLQTKNTNILSICYSSMSWSILDAVCMQDSTENKYCWQK